MTQTPILFIIFNRPDTSLSVFEEIRKAKPKRLYVAADGPRYGNELDKINCQQTRDLIKVDWDCEVKLLFRSENMGCKKAVSQAITWFFEHEEQGIILEDDCIPHLSFFNYCEELLNYYKNNSRVMHISGDNFQNGKHRGDASYYFSENPHIWGWATWKRAWLLYDAEMKALPEFIEQNQIAKIFNNPKIQKFWIQKLEKTINQKIDTWDAQWMFTIWKNNGISILPNVNLISNIGFLPDATHTKVVDKHYANLPINEIKFPLIHPKAISTDISADNYTFNRLYKKSLLKKIRLIPYLNYKDILLSKR